MARTSRIVASAFFSATLALSLLGTEVPKAVANTMDEADISAQSVQLSDASYRTKDAYGVRGKDFAFFADIPKVEEFDHANPPEGKDGDDSISVEMVSATDAAFNSRKVQVDDWAVAEVAEGSLYVRYDKASGYDSISLEDGSPSNVFAPAGSAEDSHTLLSDGSSPSASASADGTVTVIATKDGREVLRKSFKTDEGHAAKAFKFIGDTLSIYDGNRNWYGYTFDGAHIPEWDYQEVALSPLYAFEGNVYRKDFDGDKLAVWKPDGTKMLEKPVQLCSVTGKSEYGNRMAVLTSDGQIECYDKDMACLYEGAAELDYSAMTDGTPKLAVFPLGDECILVYEYAADEYNKPVGEAAMYAVKLGGSKSKTNLADVLGIQPVDALELVNTCTGQTVFSNRGNAHAWFYDKANSRIKVIDESLKVVLDIDSTTYDHFDEPEIGILGGKYGFTDSPFPGTYIFDFTMTKTDFYFYRANGQKIDGIVGFEQIGNGVYQLEGTDGCTTVGRDMKPISKGSGLYLGCADDENYYSAWFNKVERRLPNGTPITYVHNSEGKVGAIDDAGNVIIPIEYDAYFDAGESDASYILLKKEGAWHFASVDEAPVQPGPYPGVCSEHSWDKGADVIAPTCTEDGEKLYTCTKCGATRTEVAKKLGHEWNMPKWTWDDTFDNAFVVLLCKRDSTHSLSKTVKAQESKVVTGTKKTVTASYGSDTFTDAVVVGEASLKDSEKTVRFVTRGNWVAKGFESQATGITACNEAHLYSEELLEGPVYNALVSAIDGGTKGEIAGVFKVRLLLNGTEEVHKDFGMLTLAFPARESIAGRTVTVYHCHGDDPENITSTKYLAGSDGRIVIGGVTDLSTFALEVLPASEEKKPGDPEPTVKLGDDLSGADLAKTGDTASAKVAIMLLLSISAASTAYVAFRVRRMRAE